MIYWVCMCIEYFDFKKYIKYKVEIVTRYCFTCPPDANKAPNSSTLFISKLSRDKIHEVNISKVTFNVIKRGKTIHKQYETLSWFNIKVW